MGDVLIKVPYVAMSQRKEARLDSVGLSLKLFTRPYEWDVASGLGRRLVRNERSGFNSPHLTFSHAALSAMHRHCKNPNGWEQMIGPITLPSCLPAEA